MPAFSCYGKLTLAIWLWLKKMHLWTVPTGQKKKRWHSSFERLLLIELTSVKCGRDSSLWNIFKFSIRGYKWFDFKQFLIKQFFFSKLQATQILSVVWNVRCSTDIHTETCRLISVLLKKKKNLLRILPSC